MTMKKKLLTTLSVVLILGLAALGILAYLTDTDSDVNVMTLGNVSIEQNEYQRVQNDDGTYPTYTYDNVISYKLEDFEQGKALLPIVGDPSTGAAGWDSIPVRMSQVDSYGGMDVFAGKNAVDKFVVVKNTGKTDAYVRTLVAIEVGTTDGSLIGTSYHGNWSKNEIGEVTIDGNDYNVFEYVYKGASDNSCHVNGILPAGDTAYPNLSQVYIKSVATNEDCKKIDGNGNGTLDILVLSQAVQAEGFATAADALKAGFGEATDFNVKAWFTGMKAPAVVEDAEELEAAIEAGEDVVLTEDIVLENEEEFEPAKINVAAGEEVIIDLNGNDLVAYEWGGSIEVSGEDAVLNIIGDSEESTVENFALEVTDGATANVEGVNYESTDKMIKPIRCESGTINLKDTDISFVSTGTAVTLSDENGDVEFNMNGGTISNVQTGISAQAKNGGKVILNLNAGKIDATSNGVYATLSNNASGVINMNISKSFSIVNAIKIIRAEYKNSLSEGIYLNGMPLAKGIYTSW